MHHHLQKWEASEHLCPWTPSPPDPLCAPGTRPLNTAGVRPGPAPSSPAPAPTLSSLIPSLPEKGAGNGPQSRRSLSIIELPVCLPPRGAVVKMGTETVAVFSSAGQPLDVSPSAARVQSPGHQARRQQPGFRVPGTTPAATEPASPPASWIGAYSGRRGLWTLAPEPRARTHRPGRGRVASGLVYRADLAIFSDYVLSVKHMSQGTRLLFFSRQK